MTQTQYLAKDVMAKDPSIAPVTAAFGDVIKLMVEKDGRAVILTTDDHQLAGLFSDSDLADAVLAKVRFDTPIKDLMTPNPSFVFGDERVEKCVEIMSTLNCRNIPVVENGRVIGVVGILNLQKMILEKQRHQVEMLRLRDEYLGVVAHDVRSPVGTIRTCLEMMELNEDQEPIGDQQRAMINSMKDCVSTSLNLVNDLLDIRRLNDGMPLNLRKTNIQDLLSGLCEISSIAAKEKKISIRHDNKAELFADVDGKRYEEIVRNLLDNAIKFSPSGREIIVWAEKTNDGWLRVSVKDQGAGVPKEKIDIIFGKFRQLENEQNSLGFGLGLSIAMQFANLHGGRVEISETSEKDTTFSIFTPIDRKNISYSKT